MTLLEVWHWYLKTLVEQAQFDLSVFTNGWLWLPFGIPILFYFAFFVVKWYLLLFPVYAPFVVFTRALRYILKGN